MDDPNVYLRDWQIESVTSGGNVTIDPDTGVVHFPDSTGEVTVSASIGEVGRYTPNSGDVSKYLCFDGITQQVSVTRPLSGTITNPGTAYSQPIITVDGVGDIALTIGAQTMNLVDVPSGGILLDCDMLDAMNPERTALMNSYVDSSSDGFFRIQPGINAIGISTGGESGKGSVVNKVTIVPNWRDI